MLDYPNNVDKNNRVPWTPFKKVMNIGLITVGCLPFVLFLMLWLFPALFISFFGLGLESVEVHEVGTARVHWLPASARDVSHYRVVWLDRTEYIGCALPYADFAVLAAAKNWTMELKYDVPINFGYPLKFPDRVQRALVYEPDRSKDRTLPWCVIFDLDHNRMYVNGGG